MPSVALSKIERVTLNSLDKRRLDTLKDGYSSFDNVLNSSSDPITLDKKSGEPYQIIDGRHRVYLAREKGYTSVNVKFIG